MCIVQGEWHFGGYYTSSLFTHIFPTHTHIRNSMPLLIPTFFLRRKTQSQHMRQGPRHDLPFLMQAWLPSPSWTGYSRWRPSIVSKHVHVQDKLPTFSSSPLTLFLSLLPHPLSLPPLSPSFPPSSPSFSPSSLTLFLSLSLPPLTEFNELKSELVEFLQDFEKEKKVCHCVAMATKLGYLRR